MTVTAAELQTALTGLDQAVAGMDVSRGTMVATYGHRSPGSAKEHPDLPINVEAFDRQREAWTYVLNLALRVAHTTRVLLPKWDSSETTAQRVHRVTNYVFAFADVVAGYTEAGDIHARIVAHTRACEGIRERQEPKVFAGRCAECETDLYAVKGQPEARCGTCSATYEVLAWRSFAKTIFGNHIGTPADLSRKLSTPEYGIEISADRIRKWGLSRNNNPPKLERANPTHDEHQRPIPPAYRLRDVLDLYEAARKQPLEGRTA